MHSSQLLELAFVEGPAAGRAYRTASAGTAAYIIGIAGDNNLTGSTDENGFQVPDPAVGLRHAVLIWAGSAWMVRDLWTPTGTEINGRRISGASNQWRGAEAADCNA